MKIKLILKIFLFGVIWLHAGLLKASGLYEFHIDGENLSGPPASYLNKPIMANDRVYVGDDGHFYTSADNRRIRFWGVNLTPPLTFPRNVDEAENIATRLEKLGFNLVRLHALDADPKATEEDPNVTDEQYRSIVEFNNYPTLNAENLDALDRLFDAFANHGIYVDLPLFLGHKFDPDATKAIAMMDTNISNQQKAYAQTLLSRYKENPVLALIEIINETSLIELYSRSYDDFQTLVPTGGSVDYQSLLKGKWNDWLRTLYTTETGNPVEEQSTAATDWLDTRWAPAPVSGAVNVIDHPDFDDLDNPGPWWPDWIRQNTSGSCTPPAEGWATMQLVNVGASDNELELTLNEIPCKDYYLQVKQFEIPLEENTAYILEFTVRGDFSSLSGGIGAYDVGVSVSNKSETQTIMNSKLFTLDSTNPEDINGKTLTYYFINDSALLDARLRIGPFKISSFNGSLVNSKFYLDDVSIIKTNAGGLAVGEKLENKTVSIPLPQDSSALLPPTKQMKDDYIEFLYQTELAYMQDMRDYLKSPLLEIIQPITGTQANYGGLLGNAIANTMDYVDVHYYWDHPDFNNGNLSWNMKNRPMVDNPHITDTGFSNINTEPSILGTIAQSRIKGKPFTISEYNPNQNNQFTAEAWPSIAAYAAQQDIDGVFVFGFYRGYQDYRDDVFVDNPGPDQLVGYYNVLGEARSESLMHLAANLFRRGDVVAVKEAIQLNVSHVSAVSHIRDGIDIRRPWRWLEQEVTDYDTLMATGARIEIVHTDDTQGTLPTWAPPTDTDPITGQNKTHYETSNGDLLWVHSEYDSSITPSPFDVTTQGNSYIQINTDRSKVVVGHLGQQSILFDGLKVKGTGVAVEQFGTLSVTSVDGNPIQTSSDVLVTAIGRGSNVNLELVELIPDSGRVQNCVASATPNDCDRQFYTVEAGKFGIESSPATVSLFGAATNVTAITVLNQAGGDSGNSVQPLIYTPDPTDPDIGGYSFDVGSLSDNSPWYRVQLEQPTHFIASSTIISGTDTTVTPPVAYKALLNEGDNAVYSIYYDVPAGSYYVDLQVKARDFDGPAELLASVNGVPFNGTITIPDVLDGQWQRVMVSGQPIDIGQRGTDRTIQFNFTDVTTGEREVLVGELRLFKINTQAHKDADGDGLTNDEEMAFRTDPDVADTDGDDMIDKWEVDYGLDPIDDADKYLDKDGDRLVNRLESILKTNPEQVDSDGDGMDDRWEFDHIYYSDPNRFGVDPTIADADLDKDGDGLTNIEEYNLGSDPRFSDTDRDGEKDGTDSDPVNIISPDPEGWNLSTTADFSDPDVLDGTYQVGDNVNILAWTNVVNLANLDTNKTYYRLRLNRKTVLKGLLNCNPSQYTCQAQMDLAGREPGSYTLKIHIKDRDRVEYEEVVSITIQ